MMMRRGLGTLTMHGRRSWHGALCSDGIIGDAWHGNVDELSTTLFLRRVGYLGWRTEVRYLT